MARSVKHFTDLEVWRRSPSCFWEIDRKGDEIVPLASLDLYGYADFRGPTGRHNA